MEKKRLFAAVMLAVAAIAAPAQNAGTAGKASAKNTAKAEKKADGDRRAEDTTTPMYECLYEYKVALKGKNGADATETYNTILQIGGKFAKFEDYAAYQLDSARTAGVQGDALDKYEDQLYTSAYYFAPVVYSNHPSGQMTIDDELIPNRFRYQEQMPGAKASLGQDTATVCGYLCTKATLAYGGRDWTLWMAQDIPAAYGPWKLCGLPGLVLDAEDATHTHHFRAIAIRKATLPVVMTANVKTLKTQRGKFIKARNDFYSAPNPMEKIPMEGITDMQIIKGKDDNSVFLINGVQLREKHNGFSPLETE